MQRGKVAAKSVAVAVAFSMAFTMAAGVKADAAKKAPKLNQKRLDMIKGETFKLKVVKNKNKISKVTWKSNKPAVAKVSKKGLVKAVDAGKATIKATFKANKKKMTRKCKVFVSDTPAISGGWEIPESPVVTDELKVLVQQFAESGTSNGKGSLQVTPYALLGTQIVNGTGYRVLCRVDLGKDETGKEVSSYSIVQIYADFNGKLIADSSRLIAYTDDFASEAVVVSGSGATVSGSGAILGGFVQFDDPTIPAESLAAFEKFYADKNIPFPYKPIARIAHRESTGKVEVSLVCAKDLGESSGNVGTDEPIGYFIIKMTLDSTTNQHTGTSVMIFPISFKDTNYDVCINSMMAVDVETQAAWIRSFILGAAEKDMESVTALMSKISYPVTVDGKEVKTQDEFTALFASKQLSADFVLEIRKATCMQMFARDQGIMLGSGDHNIWLNQDSKDKTQIKITAINGMFAK